MRREAYDAVHVHTPIASVLGRVAARLAGTSRIIYTAHGFYFHDRMPRPRYLLYEGIERVASRLTHVILTQSREDFDTARRRGLFPSSKLRYLGNGVDVSWYRSVLVDERRRIALRNELLLPENTHPLVGITGRLTEEKGFQDLAQAMSVLRAGFPAAHLLVIGDQLGTDRDPFRLRFDKRISELGLSRHVTFAGFRSDVRDLLSLLDIFVLPSYREGLPRSILEAMSMGLPVVASRIRGSREAVVDGVTGLLVPPGNAEALGGALIRLAANEALRRSLGSAGRNRAEVEYDERLVFHRLERAYTELGLL